MKIHWSAVFATSFCLLQPLNAKSAPYRIVDIHPSGYSTSYAKSVNSVGQAAGLACDTQNNCDVFFWAGPGSTPRILTRAGFGTNSNVIVNANGEVFADTTAGIVASASNGGTLRLALPNYRLLGANDTGQLIASTGSLGSEKFYFVPAGSTGTIELSAAPNGAKVLSVDGINNAGQVVGRLYTDDTLRNPYVYITGFNGSGIQPINSLLFQYVVGRPLSVDGFKLAGVNDSGQIAGFVGTSGDSSTRGFYTSSDRTSFQNYPAINGNYFLPRKFNNANQAVGYISSNGEYLYSAGALTRIVDLVPSQAGAWGSIQTSVIGAAGDIAGTGQVVATGAYHALVITQSPGKVPTNISISGAPSQITTGQSATATTTVYGSAPTGNVRWLVDGSVAQNATLSPQGATSSTTSFQIPSSLSIGTHSISAEYAGDGQNLPSAASPVSIRVIEVLVPTATVPTAPQWALLLGAVGLFAIAARRGLRRQSLGQPR